MRNAEITLSKERQQLEAEKHSARELQAIIETLSHTSDNASANATALLREKTKLEARVREMEQEIRETRVRNAPSGLPRPGRRRSSSVQDTRTNSAQQELRDAHKSLAEKDDELRALRSKLETAKVKLETAESALMKVENEKIANEKSLRSRLQELQSLVEERDDELNYLRSERADCGREEELVRRVEEDEAKIEALQRALRQEQQFRSNQGTLDKMEERVKVQLTKIREIEDRNVELVAEREEALAAQDDLRRKVAQLNTTLQERNEQDR
jgi:myosin protein heavy chain